MNIFITKNKNIAKQELLITAVQDYREDLVKFNANLNGYQEAELFADRSYLLDIGMPETFTIEQAALYCLANASMQYKFWTNYENNYKRYAQDGKSGAILMSNLFIEYLIPEFNNQLYTLPEEFYRKLNQFPNVRGIDRADAINTLFRLGTTRENISNLAAAIVEGNHVTVYMAKVLADTFPNLFADPYLKKAQLALFMLASWMNTYNKTETPVDISNLTLFADYQVPRVMQQLGLLTYHPCVYKAIGMYVEFPEDSTIEKALRAATVLAGEEIANKYMVPAAVVDNWLWTRRNECTYPHHLTNTSRY